ncbi:hypothetical protein AGMMS50212_05600 [Spirochaetia bacterium]|nr:hypothetical protein AGMMS50212_05600 [Spirochaetia bacterium]
MENDITCQFCGKKFQLPDVVKNKIIAEYMDAYMEQWDIELEKEKDKLYAKILKFRKKYKTEDDFEWLLEKINYKKKN